MKLITLIFGAAIAVGLVSTSVSAQTAEPSYKADPDVYKVIFEDANFRVIEGNRKKGVRDKMHSHPVPSIVYNLTDCKSKQYFADGKTSEQQAKAGTVTAIPIIAAHSAENISATDCRQIFVEKK